MTACQAHIFKAGARNAATEEEAAARDSWQTPWPIVYALCHYAYGDVDGFDLDVAASDGNAKAPSWYTAEVDGLAHSWRLAARPGGDVWSKRIWCNPPWSTVTMWLERFLDEQASGVAIGPLSDTTVRWSVLHPHIPWRIIGDGRLAFEDAHGVRQKNPGQAALAWFFRPGQRLAAGGGVISDRELAEVAARVQTVQGLPLFG